MIRLGRVYKHIDIFDALAEVTEAMICTDQIIERPEYELERHKSRIDSSPIAIMDARDSLGICVPAEENFPALYSIRGKRVRLVVVDE